MSERKNLKNPHHLFNINLKVSMFLVPIHSPTTTTTVSGRRNKTSVAAMQNDYEKVYITAIVITLGITMFICIACIIMIGVCIVRKRR